MIYDLEQKIKNYLCNMTQNVSYDVIFLWYDKI